MPETPRNYELNYGASNELEAQLARAKATLERIAADLAFAEPGRPGDELDLVERHHVLRAAEMLFGPEKAPPPDTAGSPLPSSSSQLRPFGAPPLHPFASGSYPPVFISYSREDRGFVEDLRSDLQRVHI